MLTIFLEVIPVIKGYIFKAILSPEGKLAF